jgi:hypothetical protein
VAYPRNTHFVVLACNLVLLQGLRRGKQAHPKIQRCVIVGKDPNNISNGEIL